MLVLSGLYDDVLQVLPLSLGRFSTCMLVL